MADSTKLKTSLTKLESLEKSNAKLYFITRHLKAGVPQNQKMLDKHTFDVFKADLDEDLQSHFTELLKTQMTKSLQNKESIFEEYSVISDDIQNTVYTYAANNALTFSQVVTDKLRAGTDTPTLSSLTDIKNDLWAYCIGIDFGKDGKLLSFRKTQKSKIVKEKGQNCLEKFQCYFDTSESKLKSFDKSAMHFDDKIDCIFYDGLFYVLRKGSFEAMVGLEEEFLTNAATVIADLTSTKLFEGIELLEEECQKSPRLLRKLANIAKMGGHLNITKKRLEQMETICKHLNLNLKTKDGKLIIEDSNDVDLVVKMLDYYFVECMQTQRIYGSHSKKLLKK